jgi:ABC-type uncharacterized transport system permease subunit
MELSLVPLLVAAALRAGTAILLAALGELLAERAGVLNLGVEGTMLVGALAGFIATHQTGEPWVGLLAAALGAYLFGGVQALQLRLQAIGIAMPTYLLLMAPYGFTILVLIFASDGRARRRFATPAALGTPYIRGE